MVELRQAETGRLKALAAVWQFELNSVDNKDPSESLIGGWEAYF